MKKVIHEITRYTMGIYCVHNLIGRILNQIFLILNIDVDKLLFCLFVYILSYGCCAVMDCIKCKYIRQIID